MPAPFSPKHISFVSGVRNDLGSIAQDDPAQLKQAVNVMFTKKGQITGRPGLQNKDAIVQTGGAGAATLPGLSSVATPYPAGVVSTGFPSFGLPETPLLAWQGFTAFQRNKGWIASGPLWSLRQTKSASFRTFDPVGTNRPSPIPCGASTVCCTTSIGSQTGFPLVDSTGSITGVLTPALTNFDSDANTCIAGEAIFFVKIGTGTVYGHIPTSGLLPMTGVAATEVVVGTSADATSTPVQNTSAVRDGGGAYYVAYKTTTSGLINVVRLSAAGAVTQTLGLSGLGSVSGLALSYDPATNRLGLVWRTGTTVKTKILTITAGVMADAAIDLTLTGTGLILLGSDPGTLAAGTTHNGKMSVMFDQGGGALGSVYIGGRSYTTATETAITSINGFSGTSVIQWSPLFGAVTVAGRTLLGIQSAMGLSLNQASQWAVMDFTSLYASGNTTDRIVAAVGQQAGMARITPSAAYGDGHSVSFVIPEGILFTESTNDIVPSVRRAAVRRITLSPQGTQAVHSNGTTLLSGQLMHVFDGTSVRPDHFPEEAPVILKDSAAAAGGSLSAASYSYQVTWEAYNGAGQTIRSGASNIFTVSVAAGQKVNIITTKPQLWTNPSQLQFVRLRLWATQPNPTNNALKYLAAEATSSNPASGATVTLTHTTNVTGNEEALYETVDTLADMRAPGADRGVAVVAERTWVADQTQLYVSKIMRPGVAVAFNTENTNVLTLPASLGTIQALSTIQQNLVVLCSRGAAVVTGPGVDDTGAGAGWTLQVLDGIPGMGESSPRAVAATPAGAAYQAIDGDLWLVSSTGTATPMSRPLRDQAQQLLTRNDVAVIPSTPTRNTMLVAYGANSVLRVLDMELGQWGTWNVVDVSPTNGLFISQVNGALWLQCDSGSTIIAGSLETNNSSDINPFTATIETGVLRPAMPIANGWGRLQRVVINEVRAIDDDQVTYTLNVFADQNQRVLISKSRNTSPEDVVFFTGGPAGQLEFRATVQRCSYFTIRLDITPAIFNLEGLDVWVANTGEPTPTNSRS